MGHRSDLATSASTATLEAAPQGRRRYYRQKIRNLAYISIDSTNQGVLRDLSESGAAVHVLAPLHADQRINIRLDLTNPRARVEGSGRVAWTDSLGQSGVEFLDVPLRSKRLLKDWLLTQVLADAHRATEDPAAGLLFSFSPRPTIRLQPTKSQRHLRFLWFRVSAHRFARLVDSLALLCAVLLFNVMALTLTDTLPSWPVALAAGVAVTATFAGLYWFLFSKWFGITPGHRLAELAVRGGQSRKRRGEVRSRFR